MRPLVKPIGVLLFCVASTSMAGVLLQPVPAPEWQVSAWLDDEPGSLGDHRGRVVLIGFFHPSCSETVEFSAPLFRRWSALYGDREDVDAVLIHGGLQGRAPVSPERLAEFVRQSAIVWPVGLDGEGGLGEPGPLTARRYEISRTPHLVIVDKRGMLRFSHTGAFDLQPVESFIERLTEETAEMYGPTSGEAARSEPVPPAAGADLSGTWMFRTEKATGRCARWIPHMEVPAELRVYRDSIDVEFVRPLLGMNDLELSFDADTGRVEGESRPTDAGASRIASGRVLRLEGVLGREAEPPELEFELILTDVECSIQGRARAGP